jgi:hypothetical protein
MGKAIVKADHLNFDGKQYFRVGSEDVNVGSYGEKRIDSFPQKILHPKTKGDHVEVHSALKLDKATTHQVATVEIDEKASDNISGGASGVVKVAGVPVNVTASASGSHEHTKDDEVKLIKMVLDLAEIADQLNADKHGAIADMIQAGHHARIVHEVFIVVSAKLADSLDTSKAVNLSGGTTVNAVNVTASVKGDEKKSAQTSMTLDKGQIFAYSTLKFKDEFLDHYYVKSKNPLEKPKLKDGILEQIQKSPPKLAAANLTEDQFGKGH